VLVVLVHMFDSGVNILVYMWLNNSELNNHVVAKKYVPVGLVYSLKTVCYEDVYTSSLNRSRIMIVSQTTLFVLVV